MEFFGRLLAGLIFVWVTLLLFIHLILAIAKY